MWINKVSTLKRALATAYQAKKHRNFGAPLVTIKTEHCFQLSEKRASSKLLFQD